MSLHVNEVLLAPVVTEKAYGGVEAGKYAFRVHPDAHKTQIRQAVEQLFDVKVERVNVSMVQPKPKRRGTHRGTKPGWKKAIVQLRQGDSIEIFGGVQL
jgi:large subunit ribosomal protein L23